MRTLRVVFVYGFLGLGGVEAVLSTRTRELDAHRIESSLWFFHDLGGAGLFSSTGTPIRVGPIGDLLRWLSRDPVDIVAAIDTPDLVDAARDLESDGMTVVFESHSTYLAGLEFLNKLRHRSGPTALLVPSQHQQRRVRTVLGRAGDVTVAPNPLGEPFAAALDPPHPPVRPIMSWVGRFDDHKDWRSCLRVVRDVTSIRPDVEAWLAGPWSREVASDLVWTAHGLGILDRIRLLGPLPPRQIARLHDVTRASGGVHLSTSTAEAFGMTVLEAMARGCAVVVPEIEPFEDLVEDQMTGRIYSRDCARSATHAVMELLDDPDGRSRMGRRAREVALAGHRSPAVIPTLARALRRAADGRRLETS